jgi:hypothetical protein
LDESEVRLFAEIPPIVAMVVKVVMVVMAVLVVVMVVMVAMEMKGGKWELLLFTITVHFKLYARKIEKVINSESCPPSSAVWSRHTAHSRQ